MLLITISYKEFFNFSTQIIWYFMHHHHPFFHFSIREIDVRILRIFLKIRSRSCTMVTHFVKGEKLKSGQVDP